jgi:GTP-binding protein EngB required for normal cell division
MPKKLEELISNHIKDEEQKLALMFSKIDKIENNHLSHIQASLSVLEDGFKTITDEVVEIKISIAMSEINMKWVKWGTLLIISSLVGGSLALIFK